MLISQHHTQHKLTFFFLSEVNKKMMKLSLSLHQKPSHTAWNTHQSAFHEVNSLSVNTIGVKYIYS